MDNVDVATSSKVLGHTSNISQMKRETDLLNWHCLMNRHLPSSPGERWWAGISLQNSRSWARQSQISMLVIQDQKLTADTAVLGLFLKCLVWMNGMALFSLKDVIPIPCAATFPGGKSSPFFYHRTSCLPAFRKPSPCHIHPGVWGELSVSAEVGKNCRCNFMNCRKVIPGKKLKL